MMEITGFPILKIDFCTINCKIFAAIYLPVLGHFFCGKIYGRAFFRYRLPKMPMPSKPEF